MLCTCFGESFFKTCLAANTGQSVSWIVVVWSTPEHFLFFFFVNGKKNLWYLIRRHVFTYTQVSFTYSSSSTSLSVLNSVWEHYREFRPKTAGGICQWKSLNVGDRMWSICRLCCWNQRFCTPNCPPRSLLWEVLRLHNVMLLPPLLLGEDSHSLHDHSMSQAGKSKHTSIEHFNKRPMLLFSGEDSLAESHRAFEINWIVTLCGTERVHDGEDDDDDDD